MVLIECCPEIFGDVKAGSNTLVPTIPTQSFKTANNATLPRNAINTTMKGSAKASTRKKTKTENTKKQKQRKTKNNKHKTEKNKK